MAWEETIRTNFHCIGISLICDANLYLPDTPKLWKPKGVENAKCKGWELITIWTDSKHPDIFSTAIAFGDGIAPKEIDIGEMVDIFPILCNLLELNI